MSDLDARLTELSVFAAPEQAAGLPRSLFYMLLFIAGGWSVAVAWWLGLAFLALVYPPLYQAHKADPAALEVWRHALTERIEAIDPTLIRFLTVDYIA